MYDWKHILLESSNQQRRQLICRWISCRSPQLQWSWHCRDPCGGCVEFASDVLSSPQTTPLIACCYARCIRRESAILCVSIVIELILILEAYFQQWTAIRSRWWFRNLVNVNLILKNELIWISFGFIVSCRCRTHNT